MSNVRQIGLISERGNGGLKNHKNHNSVSVFGIVSVARRKWGDKYAKDMK
jgi:hypothetical protein